MHLAWYQRLREYVREVAKQTTITKLIIDNDRDEKDRRSTTPVDVPRLSWITLAMNPALWHSMENEYVMQHATAVDTPTEECEGAF